MLRPREELPFFSLYGEDAGLIPAGFVHIETIAARSSLHDWEIRPHRHRQNVQVLLLHYGRAEAQLGDAAVALDAPCFIAVPQGAAHGFRFAPETQGHVVSLSAEFLSRCFGESDPLLALLTEGGHGNLPEHGLARLAWLAEELLDLTTAWPQDAALIHALFEALLRSLPHGASSRPLDPRIAQFRQLIERHLREQRAVGFYAERIGLSSRSLSRLCREHLGCSPGEAINRRLAAEAQRMLCFSSASAVEVADELGFSDPSWFSRFYRRMTGRRPSEEKREAP